MRLISALKALKALKLASLLCLLGLSACVTSRSAEEKGPGSGGAPQAVPALFRGDGIRVLVAFDGHEEVCFLDTGSPFTVVVNAPFFERYEKRVSSPVTSVAGRLASSSEITVRKVSIGGYERTDQTISVGASLAPVFGRCILGLDLLRDKVLMLDFKKNSFTLADEPPPGRNTQELGFTEQGHLLVPLRITSGDGTWGTEVMAVLDSGFLVTTLSPEVIKAHQKDFRFVDSYTSGTDAQGNPVSYKGYRTDAISIGDLKGPSDMPVSSLDGVTAGKLPARAFIGFRMISQYNWLIDLKGKRWAAWDY